MSIRNVTISIDREDRSIKPGAVRGQDIINLTELDHGEQLMLEVADDLDIPLLPEDLIFIRGGEKFSIGDGHPEVQENPRIRNPVAFALNGAVISEQQRMQHAKVTGIELKELTGCADLDLWADLEGIADEIIEDTDRIVLQERDRFFTIPRDAEDRFYDVTILLDGEDRQLRFPAAMTVREVIRRCLPPADRPNVNDFEMVDGNVSTTPLNPDVTLKDAGVRDGHVLSITKKSGGGG